MGLLSTIDYDHPILTIIHCYPLLSIIIHHYPLLSIIIHYPLSIIRYPISTISKLVTISNYQQLYEQPSPINYHINNYYQLSIINYQLSTITNISTTINYQLLSTINYQLSTIIHYYPVEVNCSYSRIPEIQFYTVVYS